MQYRKFGNLDFEVSALGFGAMRFPTTNGDGTGIDEPEAIRMLHYAIDRGVNLVHISTQYKGGESIKKLARVLKTRRDKVYIALKDNYSTIDDALRRLGVDYVDFLMYNRHSRSAAAAPTDARSRGCLVLQEGA